MAFKVLRCKERFNSFKATWKWNEEDNVCERLGDDWDDEEDWEEDIDCSTLEEEDCREVEYCYWTDYGCLFEEEDWNDEDGEEDDGDECYSINNLEECYPSYTAKN